MAWQSMVAPAMTSTSVLWLSITEFTYSASCSSVMIISERPSPMVMAVSLPPSTVILTSILSWRPSTTAVYSPSAASAHAGPVFSSFTTSLTSLSPPKAVWAAVRPESMASERNTPF